VANDSIFAPSGLFPYLLFNQSSVFVRPKTSGIPAIHVHMSTIVVLRLLLAAEFGVLALGLSRFDTNP
jgi:hypothetical protein